MDRAGSTGSCRSSGRKENGFDGRGRDYPANEHFPALVYPNPLHPSKYVVINTGLTISDPDYNGDYGMPQWGDYAMWRRKKAPDVPELVTAGLFDEGWHIR